VGPAVGPLVGPAVGPEVGPRVVGVFVGPELGTGVLIAVGASVPTLLVLGSSQIQLIFIWV